MIYKVLVAIMLSISGEEKQAMSTPDYLYKVLSKTAWEESQQGKSLSLNADDTSFIHLSTGAQLPRITDKFFKGIDYVILKVETKKMQGRLVFETNPGGENKYYHLYDGVIPLEAVVEVVKGDQ